jgi:hypothetical protein
VKKVRLVTAGAVGMMLPVAGPLIPAAYAATAAAGAKQVKQVKTVLAPHSTAPDVACAGHLGLHANSRDFNFSVFHTPSTHCVGGVSARLNECLTGFVLRTRAYSTSRNGTKTRYMNSFVGGHSQSCGILNDGPGYYTFYQGIHQIRPAKEQVCEALVFANNLNKVFRGPVCVSF